MKKRTKKKMLISDYVIYAVLFFGAFIMLFPFWFVIVGSFNNGVDYSAGGVWVLPRVWTTANYQIVLSDKRLWTGFGNTIARTVLGTALSLLFTSVVAYAFSRPNLKFKKFFRGFNIFTMFFSGGLIPFFLLIRILGLYDTFWVYILPNLYSVYNMIVISSYFRGVSRDIYESAVIDGANQYRIWWSIYIPLGVPILATVGMWIALSNWNAYMATMLYTEKESLITLQYYLMRLIKDAGIPEGMDGNLYEQISATTLSFAAIVVSTIPLLCCYPFVLKTVFKKGTFEGSVKE